MLPDLPIERLSGATPEQLMLPDLAVERSARSPDGLMLPDLPVERSASPEQRPAGRTGGKSRRQQAAASPAADSQLAATPTKPAAAPPQQETKQVTRWALSPKFKELQATFKIPTGQLNDRLTQENSVHT